MSTNSIGSIHLIVGCMFSGKTTELQRIYQKWSAITKPLCINYIDDTRYGEMYNVMYNHNKVSVDCIKVRNLKDVPIEKLEGSNAYNFWLRIHNIGALNSGMLYQVIPNKEKYYQVY